MSLKSGHAHTPSSPKALALIICLALSLAVACAAGARVQSGGGGNKNVQQGQGSGIGHSSKAAEKKPASETVGDPATVETRLTELFDICKNGKAEDAASYFVYRGPDKSREWKDTLHADEPADKAALEGGCWEIKNLLDNSQLYVLGEVKVKRESEGEWHALEVSFQQGEKTKKVIFAFLLVNGEYAIGDVDR